MTSKECVLAAQTRKPKAPSSQNIPHIGVLALQGAFAAHAAQLQRCGYRPSLIRTACQLAAKPWAGLVLPGGESGVQLQLLVNSGLFAPLQDMLRAGTAVLGTCAGAILLAKQVCQPQQQSLQLIDMDVQRNAYGRQLYSFAARSDCGNYNLVAIRAPKIIRVGPGVQVLAALRGQPVLVKHNSAVACVFHPELTDQAAAVYALAFGCTSTA